MVLLSGVSHKPVLILGNFVLWDWSGVYQLVQAATQPQLFY